MRIISGELKGREVSPPNGSRVRPASGFVREMAMSIFGPERLQGGPFADICAGSGIVGLEALSRGAPRVYFIEAERRQCAHITQYCERYGVLARCRVICTDARRLRKSLEKPLAGKKLAAAFADPPFISGMAQSILLGIGRASSIFAEDALIILRSEDELTFPVEGVELLEKRGANHGDFWLLRPLASQSVEPEQEETDPDRLEQAEAEAEEEEAES